MGKASFCAQSNALFRKNLTYQKRNKSQNCCLFVSPVLILFLLTMLERYVKHLYSSKPLTPVSSPPEWPPVIQIPTNTAVRSKALPFSDLPDASCLHNGSCPATFLVTAYNQSFGLGMASDMFPIASSEEPSDLLAQLVLGMMYSLKDSYLSDPAFREGTDLYYLQPKCREDSSFRVPIEKKTYELRCKQSLTLWRNSSSEINSEIFEGNPEVNTEKKHYAFAGAYDFLNSNSSIFNVTVWYQTSEPFTDSTSLTGVERLVNMVSNAYLQFSHEKVPEIVLEFIEDMPTHSYVNSPSIVASFSALLFVWIVVWLFPVILQALVYEKQHNLRMMMKMHGLGDGAYWTISYGYFAIVSSIYMLCFAFFGSILRLAFFTMNDYGIQFVFYFVYVNLQVSMAFLASALFSTVKTAAVVGYLLVFVTGLLGNFLFQNLLQEPSFPRKWVTVLELFPGFALFRGLYELQLSASEGSVAGQGGMQWEDLNDPENGMKEVIIIMFVEWLITLFLAYNADRASSSGYICLRKPSSYARQPNRHRNGTEVRSDLERPDVVQEREKVEELLVESPASQAIVCDNIRKVYPARDGNLPKVAVKGMYLALPRTGCFGLLGPNGAGKTSFISMMIGLTKPTSGTAFVNGLDLRTSMDEIYSMMGVCPQHDLLWETLTGREHLLFYGRLKNLTDAALNEAVEESLKNVNLFYGGLADKQAGKYSGGMKRRLSVAISLIGNPKVVYMDEPSTGLDPASRNNLWNVVRLAKEDRAIILTTHSMEEAEALCDRLGIFVDGSLQCIADAKELKARYGGSLVLTITTTPEHDGGVENMVRHLCPNARKTYHIAGTQKFELPKHEVRIADVFEAVEIAKSQFPVHAWGLADTTLEDVFIKVATSS